MSVEPGVDYPRPAVMTALPARSGVRRRHPYAGPIALISAGCAGLLANITFALLPEVPVPDWLAVTSVFIAIAAIIAPIIAGRVGGLHV